YRPNKNLEIKKFGRGVSDDFCSIKKRTSQFKMLFIAQSLRYIKVPVGASTKRKGYNFMTVFYDGFWLGLLKTKTGRMCAKNTAPLAQKSISVPTHITRKRHDRQYPKYQ
ncbi:MAG: hypothetical protein ACTII2_05310, partial [Psychrobacter celer]